MTLVKVCGLTREADVEAACALGAAYVGFNFSALSPRRVDVSRARKLAAAAASGVVRVGVFVDETYERIDEAVEAAGLDLVQLHRPLREEDLEFVARPIIAVAHPGKGNGEGEERPPDALLGRCAAILLDGSSAAAPGGSGVPFDWSRVDGSGWPVALFVAGGLSPDNVADAIRTLRPQVVDVASGVESAPGRKDGNRMRLFFEAVRRTDRE